ncbi:hypothetical protein V8E54_013951 [Elaphomyces granulatus]
MERKTERDVEGGRKSEEEAEDVQVRQRQVCQTRQGEWDEEALDTLFNETIRFSVVNSYVSAITELYVWQTQSEGKPVLPLRGAKLSAVLESVRRDEDRIRRVNFIDRPVHRHERARCQRAWEGNSRVLGDGIDDAWFGVTVTRSESRRDVQIADLVFVGLENEGPKPDEAVPCMLMSMRQGKQNQHGKVEYMGCMRNVNPIREGTAPASELQYSISVCMEHEDVLGIHSKEKTHSARKQSVRHAELSGLPPSLRHAVDRRLSEGREGYFLPEVPGESLASKVWPEADIWLQRMESYHPDRADNEVVRLDLA